LAKYESNFTVCFHGALPTRNAAGVKTSSMNENRRALRVRTLKGGSIRFGIALTIDCIIRNMSDTGAQLLIQNTVGIPAKFTLLVKPDLTEQNCNVVWRKIDRIGVQFMSGGLPRQAVKQY
jgi:hypothetical protein